MPPPNEVDSARHDGPSEPNLARLTPEKNNKISEALVQVDGVMDDSGKIKGLDVGLAKFTVDKATKFKAEVDKHPGPIVAALGEIPRFKRVAGAQLAGLTTKAKEIEDRAAEIGMGQNTIREQIEGLLRDIATLPPMQAAGRVDDAKALFGKMVRELEGSVTGPVGTPPRLRSTIRDELADLTTTNAAEADEVLRAYQNAFSVDPVIEKPAQPNAQKKPAKSLPPADASKLVLPGPDDLQREAKTLQVAVSQEIEGLPPAERKLLEQAHGRVTTFNAVVDQLYQLPFEASDTDVSKAVQTAVAVAKDGKELGDKSSAKGNSAEPKDLAAVEQPRSEEEMRRDRLTQAAEVTKKLAALARAGPVDREVAKVVIDELRDIFKRDDRYSLIRDDPEWNSQNDSVKYQSLVYSLCFDLENERDRGDPVFDTWVNTDLWNGLEQLRDPELSQQPSFSLQNPLTSGMQQVNLRGYVESRIGTRLFEGRFAVAHDAQIPEDQEINRVHQRQFYLDQYQYGRVRQRVPSWVEPLQPLDQQASEDQLIWVGDQVNRVAQGLGSTRQEGESYVFNRDLIEALGMDLSLGNLQEQADVAFMTIVTGLKSLPPERLDQLAKIWKDKEIGRILGQYTKQWRGWPAFEDIRERMKFPGIEVASELKPVIQTLEFYQDQTDRGPLEDALPELRRRLNMSILDDEQTVVTAGQFECWSALTRLPASTRAQVLATWSGSSELVQGLEAVYGPIEQPILFRPEADRNLAQAATRQQDPRITGQLNRGEELTDYRGGTYRVSGNTAAEDLRFSGLTPTGTVGSLPGVDVSVLTRIPQDRWIIKPGDPVKAGNLVRLADGSTAVLVGEASRGLLRLGDPQTGQLRQGVTCFSVVAMLTPEAAADAVSPREKVLRRLTQCGEVIGQLQDRVNSGQRLDQEGRDQVYDRLRQELGAVSTDTSLQNEQQWTRLNPTQRHVAVTQALVNELNLVGINQETDSWLNQDLWVALDQLRGPDVPLTPFPGVFINDRRRNISTAEFLHRELGVTLFDPRYAQAQVEVGDDPGAMAAETTRQRQRDTYIHTYLSLASQSNRRLPSWVAPLEPLTSEQTRDQMFWMANAITSADQAGAGAPPFEMGRIFARSLTDQLGLTTLVSQNQGRLDAGGAARTCINDYWQKLNSSAGADNIARPDVAERWIDSNVNGVLTKYLGRGLDSVIGGNSQIKGREDVQAVQVSLLAKYPPGKRAQIASDVMERVTNRLAELGQGRTPPAAGEVAATLYETVFHLDPSQRRDRGRDSNEAPQVLIALYNALPDGPLKTRWNNPDTWVAAGIPSGKQPKLPDRLVEPVAVVASQAGAAVPTVAEQLTVTVAAGREGPGLPLQTEVTDQEFEQASTRVKFIIEALRSAGASSLADSRAIQVLKPLLKIPAVFPDPEVGAQAKFQLWSAISMISRYSADASYMDSWHQYVGRQIYGEVVLSFGSPEAPLYASTQASELARFSSPQTEPLRQREHIENGVAVYNSSGQTGNIAGEVDPRTTAEVPVLWRVSGVNRAIPAFINQLTDLPPDRWVVRPNDRLAPGAVLYLEDGSQRVFISESNGHLNVGDPRTGYISRINRFQVTAAMLSLAEQRRGNPRQLPDLEIKAPIDGSGGGVSGSGDEDGRDLPPTPPAPEGGTPPENREVKKDSEVYLDDGSKVKLKVLEDPNSDPKYPSMVKVTYSGDPQQQEFFVPQYLISFEPTPDVRVGQTVYAANATAQPFRVEATTSKGKPYIVVTPRGNSGERFRFTTIKPIIEPGTILFGDNSFEGVNRYELIEQTANGRIRARNEEGREVYPEPVLADIFPFFAMAEARERVSSSQTEAHQRLTTLMPALDRLRVGPDISKEQVVDGILTTFFPELVPEGRVSAVGSVTRREQIIAGQLITLFRRLPPDDPLRITLQDRRFWTSTFDRRLVGDVLGWQGPDFFKTIDTSNPQDCLEKIKGILGEERDYRGRVGEDLGAALGVDQKVGLQTGVYLVWRSLQELPAEQRDATLARIKAADVGFAAEYDRDEPYLETSSYEMVGSPEAPSPELRANDVARLAGRIVYVHGGVQGRLVGLDEQGKVVLEGWNRPVDIADVATRNPYNWVISPEDPIVTGDSVVLSNGEKKTVIAEIPYSGRLQVADPTTGELTTAPLSQVVQVGYANFTPERSAARERKQEENRIKDSEEQTVEALTNLDPIEWSLHQVWGERLRQNQPIYCADALVEATQRVLARDQEALQLFNADLERARAEAPPENAINPDLPVLKFLEDHFPIASPYDRQAMKARIDYIATHPPETPNSTPLPQEEVERAIVFKRQMNSAVDVQSLQAISEAFNHRASPRCREYLDIEMTLRLDSLGLRSSLHQSLSSAAALGVMGREESERITREALEQRTQQLNLAGAQVRQVSNAINHQPIADEQVVQALREVFTPPAEVTADQLRQVALFKVWQGLGTFARLNDSVRTRVWTEQLGEEVVRQAKEAYGDYTKPPGNSTEVAAVLQSLEESPRVEDLPVVYKGQGLYMGSGLPVMVAEEVDLKTTKSIPVLFDNQDEGPVLVDVSLLSDTPHQEWLVPPLEAVDAGSTVVLCDGSVRIALFSSPESVTLGDPRNGATQAYNRGEIAQVVTQDGGVRVLGSRTQIAGETAERAEVRKLANKLRDTITLLTTFDGLTSFAENLQPDQEMVDQAIAILTRDGVIRVGEGGSAVVDSQVCRQAFVNRKLDAMEAGVEAIAALSETQDIAILETLARMYFPQILRDLAPETMAWVGDFDSRRAFLASVFAGEVSSSGQIANRPEVHDRDYWIRAFGNLGPPRAKEKLGDRLFEQVNPQDPLGNIRFVETVLTQRDRSLPEEAKNALGDNLGLPGYLIESEVVAGGEFVIWQGLSKLSPDQRQEQLDRLRFIPVGTRNLDQLDELFGSPEDLQEWLKQPETLPPSPVLTIAGLKNRVGTLIYTQVGHGALVLSVDEKNNRATVSMGGRIYPFDDTFTTQPYYERVVAGTDTLFSGDRLTMYDGTKRILIDPFHNYNGSGQVLVGDISTGRVELIPSCTVAKVDYVHLDEERQQIIDQQRERKQEAVVTGPAREREIVAQETRAQKERAVMEAGPVELALREDWVRRVGENQPVNTFEALRDAVIAVLSPAKVEELRRELEEALEQPVVEGETTPRQHQIEALVLFIGTERFAGSAISARDEAIIDQRASYLRDAVETVPNLAAEETPQVIRIKAQIDNANSFEALDGVNKEIATLSEAAQQLLSQELDFRVDMFSVQRSLIQQTRQGSPALAPADFDRASLPGVSAQVTPEALSRTVSEKARGAAPARVGFLDQLARNRRERDKKEWDRFLALRPTEVSPRNIEADIQTLGQAVQVVAQAHPGEVLIDSAHPELVREVMTNYLRSKGNPNPAIASDGGENRALRNSFDTLQRMVTFGSFGNLYRLPPETQIRIIQEWRDNGNWQALGITDPGKELAEVYSFLSEPLYRRGDGPIAKRRITPLREPTRYDRREQERLADSRAEKQQRIEAAKARKVGESRQALAIVGQVLEGRIDTPEVLVEVVARRAGLVDESWEDLEQEEKTGEVFKFIIRNLGRLPEMTTLREAFDPCLVDDRQIAFWRDPANWERFGATPNPIYIDNHLGMPSNVSRGRSGGLVWYNPFSFFKPRVEWIETKEAEFQQAEEVDRVFDIDINDSPAFKDIARIGSEGKRVFNELVASVSPYEVADLSNDLFSTWRGGSYEEIFQGSWPGDFGASWFLAREVRGLIVRGDLDTARGEIGKVSADRDPFGPLGGSDQVNKISQTLKDELEDATNPSRLEAQDVAAEYLGDLESLMPGRSAQDLGRAIRYFTIMSTTPEDQIATTSARLPVTLGFSDSERALPVNQFKITLAGGIGRSFSGLPETIQAEVVETLDRGEIKIGSEIAKIGRSFSEARVVMDRKKKVVEDQRIDTILGSEVPFDTQASLAMGAVLYQQLSGAGDDQARNAIYVDFKAHFQTRAETSLSVPDYFRNLAPKIGQAYAGLPQEDQERLIGVLGEDGEKIAKLGEPFIKAREKREAREELAGFRTILQDLFKSYNLAPGENPSEEFFGELAEALAKSWGDEAWEGLNPDQLRDEVRYLIDDDLAKMGTLPDQDRVFWDSISQSFNPSS